MANALDKARQALEAARGKINEWDRALEQARADRAKAEQAAPADPAELDQYADTYARAAGKIRAAEQGRKVAASAELGALEEMVRAGLADAKAGVKAAQKAHDDHRRKLDALLAKVSELDGADYRPVDLDDLPHNPGETRSVKASRAAMLKGDVMVREAEVEMLTYALDHGEAQPASMFGDYRAPVPGYVHEYAAARKAAGVQSPAEAKRAAQVESERLRDEAEAEEAERERRKQPWRTRASLSGPRGRGL